MQYPLLLCVVTVTCQGLHFYTVQCDLSTCVYWFIVYCGAPGPFWDAVSVKLWMAWANRVVSLCECAQYWYHRRTIEL